MKSTCQWKLKQYSTEEAFTKRVREYLDKQPDVAYYVSSDRYMRGVSDIIANVGGCMVLLELKKAKGKPTPHQLHFIEKMTSVGGYGAVCKSIKDVEDVLEKARDALQQ